VPIVKQAIEKSKIIGTICNGASFMTKHGFARELLLLLENDIPERIEMYYQFNKQGFCQLFDEHLE